MDASDQTKSNRLLLLTIAGIPVTMILAATWLWYFVVSGDLDLVGTLGTANRGTLVRPPRDLGDAVLQDAGGAPFHLEDLERRWTMLVPLSGGRCDQICENNLYTTRQIHVAMGKEFNRIRRYLVLDRAPGDVDFTVAQLSDQRPAPASFEDYLAAEHRGAKILRNPTGQHMGLFAEHMADPTTWYLVDPASWIMMSYDGEIHYKDVMADLKFLLKNSSE